MLGRLPCVKGPAKKKRRTWRSEARGTPAVRKALRALGIRLRALRQERGLTQEGVADLARLDGKHVQAIEAGRVNVTVATLVGLSKSLDVEIGRLFAEGSPHE